MSNSNAPAQNASIKPRLLEIINSMTEDQCQKLFQKLKAIVPEDQRKHARNACSIPVNYAAQSALFAGFIKDISKGGVFIETHADLDVGEKIKLTFSSPSQPNPVKVAGEVVRKNILGFGVQFQKATEIAIRDSTWIDCRRNTAETSKERRVVPRVDFQCPVFIEGVRGQKTITDLGMGGVFIECDGASRGRFRPGQPIKLNIKLPTEDDMTQVQVDVVNFSDRGIHCQFSHLDRRAEDALMRCFNVAKHTIPIR